MKPFKTLAITLALALTFPLQVLGATFDDIAVTGENYVAIEYLVSIGTLEGYSDGTFKAETTINRAELMKVLVAGQGIEPDESTYSNCFPDVTTDWFAKYVCYAKEQGWVSGYDDNTFRPAQTVNKVEAAKMIVGAYGLDPDYSTNIECLCDTFTDVSSDDWFATYLEALFRAGIVTEEEEGSSYGTSDGMTRGMVAEYIFRSLVVEWYEYSTYTDGKRDEFLTTEGESDLIPVGAAVITDVHYDGEVYQVESDEYVEITNEEQGTLNLENYTITGSSGDEVFTFPSLELSPGESVKVYTNQGEYSFESNDAVWSNSGETVYLYDADGNLVDEYAY